MHEHTTALRRAASDAAHKDKAPGLTARRFDAPTSGNEQYDCSADGVATQAALTIEGEGYLRAWLERVSAGTAQPGELALILAFLRGEMLNGACRLIEKALEGRHHA